MVNYSVLDNGVRVITEKVTHVESIAAGIWVGAGAKHEAPPEYGVTHFIEHMLFKGTPTRSAKEIADQVANVGGHMNAATDREYTTYYMRLLKEDLRLGVDVLTDMLLNSSFDPEELEREKDVIGEEIRRHEDLPEERVHDVLAEVCWEGHELAHSVIGTEQTVRSRSRDDLVGYLGTQYCPDRIVVSIAGNVEHEQAVDLLSATLGKLAGCSGPANLPALKHVAGQRVVDKDTEAVYFCLGAPGFGESDERKYTLAVLDAVLGGGMSSRLFQEIREKRGLAYDIGSYRLGYREGGIFAVYGGTGIQTLGEVIRLARTEIQRMRDEKVSDEEIDRARAQIRGSLLLGQENMGNRMSRMGKSVLDHGRLVAVSEVIDKIMSVTADDVSLVAKELFNDDSITSAMIGPASQIEKALAV